MIWMHEISQAALAAAVATLGLVILLELRCVAKLRRAMDVNLGRVFEQLDLLRFENQQLLETLTHTRVVRSPTPRAASDAPVAPEPARTAASTVPAPPMAAAPLSAPVMNVAPPPVSALGAGEAKLLASLAAARARRTETLGADKADPSESNPSALLNSARSASRVARIV